MPEFNITELREVNNYRGLCLRLEQSQKTPKYCYVVWMVTNITWLLSDGYLIITVRGWWVAEEQLMRCQAMSDSWHQREK